MGKGVVKLGEGNWAVKDGNLLAAKETNGRFKNAEFTVTRGTDATYVGRDGLIANEAGDNTPRIDFTDNTDGHLLLEPQSTNLVTYSEDFSEWTLGNNSTLTYESDVVAPDGSLGVYRLQNPATFSTFIQSPSFSNSNPLTVSLYVKSTGSGNDNFNFYTGATNVSDLKTATSEWQRFDYTADGSSMYIVNDGDTFITDIYIWGAQAEALSYPTSYIPTNGSTVTRDAETCTGAGEAADFNSEEGVLYAEIAALADSQTYRTISLNDGTNNECVRLRFNTSSNTINGLVRDGATARGQISYQVSDIKQFHKAAFKYKSGDCQLWIDGVQRATSTDTFTLSTQTQLNFNQGTSSDIFYGKCKAIKVYKDASIDLATLTS